MRFGKMSREFARRASGGCPYRPADCVSDLPSPTFGRGRKSHGANALPNARAKSRVARNFWANGMATGGPMSVLLASTILAVEFTTICVF